MSKLLRDSIGGAIPSSVDPIREALSNIVEWSVEAPTWQRDALRRLYTQRQLSIADIEELFVLCRQPHGLLEADEASLTELPLHACHVPANWSTGGVVALKSLSQTKHVNALANDQSLDFSENGLTIVYGDNGSGKSGYGRVLKRACRARDREDILPNAYAIPSGNPSARIVYSVSGVIQPEAIWQSGVAASSDLSNISVFDSKCAEVHVDGKNELAYTPVPLQLLQALADLCRDIVTRLKREKTNLEQQIPGFRKKSVAREGTAVYQLILDLSTATQEVAINSLAQMSEQEISRLAQLKHDLVADQAKEIRRLSGQKQRIEDLVNTVKTAESILHPEKTNELRLLLLTAKDTETVAQFAASEAFNKEPLRQAGSQVWKTLWEAARMFSIREAYPTHEFPHKDDGAVCVLCQQPLSVDAAARMIAFEKFVQQKVQQDAEDSNRAIQVWKDVLKSSCVSDGALSETARFLHGELDQYDTCRLVIRSLTRARVRGRKLVAAIDPALLKTPQPIPSITSTLIALVTNLDNRIAEVQKSSDPIQRKLNEYEMCELEDRLWLNSILLDVETELQRLKKIAAYDLAMQDADTNRITRKTTELSKTLVTTAIRDAFTAEMTALKIADRRLELTQETSGYGSTKFKVSLIRNPDMKVANVLSEGEHRCVALGVFLAELSTAHNRSAIIFDDPVSSLDHNYREFVATRLVKEASSGRQVIIFTHDIVFVMMLDQEARNQGQTPHYQSVNRSEDRAGICIPGAPLKAKSVPEMVLKLDDRLATTTVLHTDGRLSEWADQVKAMAGLLRDGWERAAENVVAPVVKRFENKIHPGGLRQLTILTDEDFTALSVGYRFASTYCHTDAYAMNRPVPTPANVREEIDRLRTWSESIRLRQERKRN